jgi:6-phosphogluconolactonase (cycloisomerase 2 family)
MPGGNLAVFRIDAATGRLAPVGEPVAIHSPACIAITR